MWMVAVESEFGMNGCKEPFWENRRIRYGLSIGLKAFITLARIA